MNGGAGAGAFPALLPRAVFCACAALCGCAPPQGPARAEPAAAPGRRVVVVSDPPGALIVLNGTDTLAPAPVALTLVGNRPGGAPGPVSFEALPADTGQCVRIRGFCRAREVPDTLRFEMRGCPPPERDPETIHDTSQVTERPTRVSSPGVWYPECLREAGVEGRVVIEMVIDTAGRAERWSVRVLRATHEAFAPAAVDVALGSRYGPGRLSGRKVRTRVVLPVNFSIQREP